MQPRDCGKGVGSERQYKGAIPTETTIHSGQGAAHVSWTPLGGPVKMDRNRNLGEMQLLIPAFVVCLGAPLYSLTTDYMPLRPTEDRASTTSSLWHFGGYKAKRG